jgi:hypothetical protein
LTSEKGKAALSTPETVAEASKRFLIWTMMMVKTMKVSGLEKMA